MRKVIVTALTVLMFASSAFAAPAVSVVINGTPVSFTESSGAPFIDSNNRTLVPMRVVMEQYGCTVNWSQSTKTASVAAGDTIVLVPIGQSYITVNGEQKAIDAPAQIVSGRTYLPIRAVLEAFGANVGWDNTARSVTVAGSAKGDNTTSQGTEVGTATDRKLSYDEFIGLFDIEMYEPEDTSEREAGCAIAFRKRNTVPDSEINDLIHQDYIKRYIYDCIITSRSILYSETRLTISSFLTMPLGNVSNENFTVDEFISDFNARLSIMDED